MSPPLKNSYVSGVYRVTCRSTGRTYIGSSTDVFARFRAHLGELRRGVHSSLKMQADYNCHGADSFQLEVIEIVDRALGKAARLEAEQRWLTVECPSFNPTLWASPIVMQASVDSARRSLVVWLL